MRKRLLILTGLILLFSLPAFCSDENALSGPVTNEDPQIAELLKKAEQGDAGAQYLLGYMYAEGQGVSQNQQEAIRWYTRAAEQGHPDAPILLAMKYAEGQGIPQDFREAVKWYTTAARQGQTSAQMILSDMLARGQGIEVDLVEAYKWSLLAEHGGQDVSESKAWMAERMTAEQIAEAQRRAEELYFPLAETSIESGPIQYVSKIDGFSIRFPSPPRRTVVQDSARLSAVHYQALSVDNLIQYNVSLQRFKKQKILDSQAQKDFFEDYLVARAFYSWKNKILKKSVTFREFPAIQFKHTTYAEGKYTIHEGMIFFVQGDFVSLICIYPSQTIPSPGFQEYMKSFELITPTPTAQAD